MPAVLFKFVRQPEPGTLLGVHPPADARPFDPAMQCWQVPLFYAEPGT